MPRRAFFLRQFLIPRLMAESMAEFPSFERVSPHGHRHGNRRCRPDLASHLSGRHQPMRVADTVTNAWSLWQLTDTRSVCWAQTDGER